MTVILDYGVGNLFSLQSSFAAIGQQAEVSGDPRALQRANRVLLPGVGAFGDAAAKLEATGLSDALKAFAASGKPLLGVCLGMQLLFERSLEFGEHRGLGLVPGRVCPLQPDLLAAGYGNLKVPHIGWNPLRFVQPQSPLLQGFCQGDSVYYVHSFYAKDCEAFVVAVSDYGVQVPGVVQRGNVYGTQFHPEKSGAAGLAMLRAFCAIRP